MKGKKPKIIPIQKYFLQIIFDLIKKGDITKSGIAVRNVFIITASPIHNPDSNKLTLNLFLLAFIEDIIPNVTSEEKIIS